MTKKWYWFQNRVYCKACMKCSKPPVNPKKAVLAVCENKRCASCGRHPGEKKYWIALPDNNDELKPIERFNAFTDEEAYTHAIMYYDSMDWYLLDATGHEIASKHD